MLRPLYPQGKSPWYPLDRRLSGPQGRSGRGEEKNSQSGLEPPIFQPVAQRYTTELSRLIIIIIIIIIIKLFPCLTTTPSRRMGSGGKPLRILSFRLQLLYLQRDSPVIHWMIRGRVGPTCFRVTHSPTQRSSNYKLHSPGNRTILTPTHTLVNDYFILRSKYFISTLYHNKRN
jgi:hypothetical protein